MKKLRKFEEKKKYFSMAGIYIHIPFCKSICSYCDFYRVKASTAKPVMIRAMMDELQIRRHYLEGLPVSTIYFGGGTPSLLSVSEIEQFLGQIHHFFNVDVEAEITLEANPDDLSEAYLEALGKTRVNRLSIGVQSFLNRNLKLMNRRHDAATAITAIRNAKAFGFGNISIDMIYGIPGMKLQEWANNLDTAFSLEVKHLSAYHLTFEEGTRFYEMLQRGILQQTGESEGLKQFELLMDRTEEAGFVQYEISNFAPEGYFSRHNCSYWNQVPYLGIGPSAHSYNIHTRQWNVADNLRYLKGIQLGEALVEREIPVNETLYNEYVMTSLRTMWGLSAARLSAKFGKELERYTGIILKPFIDSGHVEERNGNFILTRNGKFIADYIIRQLVKV